MDINSINSSTPQPSVTSQPSINQASTPINNPVFSQQESGVKTAIIATLINVILTPIIGYTNIINFIVVGVYLGLSKQIGPKTKLIFFIINFIFFFFFDVIFKKNQLNDPKGLAFGIAVTIIVSAMNAAIPLAIMWIVKKIKNKSAQKV